MVFLICIELIDLKGMQRIFRERPWEFWVALIPAAIVVFWSVEAGILMAVFLSLLAFRELLIRQNIRLVFSAVSADILAELERSGLTARLDDTAY